MSMSALRNHWRKLVAALAAGFVAMLFSVLLAPVAQAATMWATSIDVGQGDATLITCNGHRMLVDAGPSSGTSNLIAQLDKRKVKTIDYLVLTHPDADHIGGACEIYSHYKVKCTVLSRKTSSSKTYARTISAMKSEGCKVVHPKIGRVFKVGKTRVKVLYVGTASTSDTNDASIVMKATVDGRSLLLTGDISSDVERKLVSRNINLRASVLKVAHHGSRSSSCSAFLKKVKAKFAVISVGAGNSYGHPTYAAMKRIKASGAKIYRTDKSGTIIFKFKNGRVTTKFKAYKLSSSASSSKTSSKKTSSGTYVYITKTGAKYHKSWCRCLRSSKIKILLKKAKAAGYTACKICF